MGHRKPTGKLAWVRVRKEDHSLDDVRMSDLSGMVVTAVDDSRYMICQQYVDVQTHEEFWEPLDIVENGKFLNKGR